MGRVNLMSTRDCRIMEPFGLRREFERALPHAVGQPEHRQAFYRRPQLLRRRFGPCWQLKRVWPAAAQMPIQWRKTEKERSGVSSETSHCGSEFSDGGLAPCLLVKSLHRCGGPVLIVPDTAADGQEIGARIDHIVAIFDRDAADGDARHGHHFLPPRQNIRVGRGRDPLGRG